MEIYITRQKLLEHFTARAAYYEKRVNEYSSDLPDNSKLFTTYQDAREAKRLRDFFLFMACSDIVTVDMGVTTKLVPLSVLEFAILEIAHMSDTSAKALEGKEKAKDTQ